VKEILKKYKLFAATSVFLVLLFLAGLLIAFPAMERIRKKSDAIQKKILDNQISKERIGKISQMEETEKIIREKSGEIDSILNLNDEVEFIKKLENVAEQTGNKMTLVIDDAKSGSAGQKAKPAEEKKDGKKSIVGGLAYDNYISMRINTEGNYQSLINFINKLENFQYYVDIVSLETKKSTEMLEEEVSMEALAGGDIFSASQSSVPQKKTSKKEKDVLASTINIIVYTKK